MKPFILIFSWLLIAGVAKSQTWQWVQAMGSDKVDQYPVDNAVDAHLNSYILCSVGGSKINVAGHVFTGNGSRDILLASFD